MKLIQMTVNGLGSFATEQTINFATSSSERITVFHGENGAGKTSTLNAILWGLTGQVSPSLMRPSADQQREVLFNDFVLEEGTTPAVEIHFEHDGTEYRAKREFIGREIAGDFQLWAKRGGTLDPFTKNSESVMRKILPPGLARYFIFDGEGFSKSAEQSESVFKTSVENILGFDFVKRAINRVENARKTRVAEVQKISSRRIANDKNRAKYENALKQIESSDLILSENAEHIELAKEALEDIRGQIASLNIERVNELQRVARTIESDLRTLRSTLKDFEYQRLMLIGEYYRPVFGSGIISDGLNVIEEHRQKKVIPGPFNKQFIKDLIESGVCICGDCLNDEKIAVLESQLQRGYTSSLQQRLTRAQAVTVDDFQKIESFKKRYQELTIGIADRRTDIETKEEELKATQSELDDFADRERRLSELRNQEARHSAALKRAENTADDARQRKEEAQIVVRKYSVGGASTSKQEDLLNRQISKLDSVIKYAYEFLTHEMNFCHEFVKNEMRDFIAGTNIPYAVHLDNSFRFQFRTHGGKAINGSTGEQKTLEFAFLCSLVKLVKVKSKDENGLLIPAGSLPLVIDAPFSDVAERYVKYISDMLLSVSEQLTILTINKDWPALEQATEGKVGQEYLLVKNITEDGGGRVQELHRFRGKDYVCVNYGAAINHSTIKEVTNG